MLKWKTADAAEPAGRPAYHSGGPLFWRDPNLPPVYYASYAEIPFDSRNKVRSDDQVWVWYEPLSSDPRLRKRHPFENPDLLWIPLLAQSFPLFEQPFLVEVHFQLNDCEKREKDASHAIQKR